MISIIICSKYSERSDKLASNIQETIGVEYEIISIDNSKNEYFITQAYNKGIGLSKYNYLCFLHEDVNLITNNWGKILIEHLNNNPQGIVGVAGGQIATKVPSSWSELAKTQRKNFMQCGDLVSYPYNMIKMESEVVMLDGFFLACKKDFIEPILFDGNLKGFHAYDADICFRSKYYGGTNIVIYDILINHHSHGTPNRQWVECTKAVFQKWNHIFPIYVGDEKLDILEVEKRMLKRFMRKMIKFGYSYSEVVNDAYISVLWGELYRNPMSSLKLWVLYYCLFKKVL